MSLKKLRKRMDLYTLSKDRNYERGWIYILFRRIVASETTST
jgi:hypothetical protein